MIILQKTSVMKKIVTAIIIAALATCGCASLSKTTTARNAEKQQTAAKVGDKLDAKQFSVEVNYMISTRAGGKSVSGGYAVAVDGSSVDSNLPYAGQARNVPYGGGKVLTFKDEIDDYKDSGWDNGKREIVFSTDNDEDKLVYRIIVYDDGTASVFVNSLNRDSISYRGRLILE